MSGTAKARNAGAAPAMRRRQSLPASLLNMAVVAAFSATGIDACADTTISSTIGALTNSDAGNFTILSGGAIVGPATALAGGVLAGTLDNRGLVSSTGTLVTSYGVLLNGVGTTAALRNSGTILGGTAVSNGNTARTIGALTNSGLITGSSYGVYNAGRIPILANTASGVLGGGGAGLSNTGSIGVLNNAGLIAGTTFGLYNTIGAITPTISTINNTGTIIGTLGNAIYNAGVIGTLNNSGLIALIGPGDAINKQAGALNVINNTGTIAGGIANGNTLPITINGASGSAFGTLTGRNNTTGVISSNNGDLSFGSGNLLLNDHIYAGTRVVTNLGSTLKLENQIGITGNYVQNKEAGLLFAVAATGYGQLTVTGTTTIASGSTIALARSGNYGFAPGQRYVVILTTGAATYNAGNLNYSVAEYDGPVSAAEVAADGTNNLVLTLQPPATAMPVPSAGAAGEPSASATFTYKPVLRKLLENRAGNSNAVATLKALFNYDGADPGLLDVFNATAALKSVDDANRAGAQLNSSAVAVSAANSAAMVMDALTGIVHRHLDKLRPASNAGGGLASGDSAGGPAVWGQLLGGRAAMSQRADVSGYHADYHGMVAGSDTQLAPDWRVGGLLSAARINIANDDYNRSSSASVNSYGAAAYAGYHGRPWYVTAAAGAARQHYRTARVIDFPGFAGNADGSFNGQLYTASVQAGYPLALSADATVTPLTGLSYSMLRQSAYTESGGNGAALRVAPASTRSLRSDIGVKWEHALATQYGKLLPSAELRWRHEFHNARLQTVASFAADPARAIVFSTSGPPATRDSALVVLGATLSRARHLSITFDYFLEAARGYSSHSGDIRVLWEF